MNADAIRHFYEYHFAFNRFIWDSYITPLASEKFNRESAYSRGSVRDQIVHIMEADELWFSELTGSPFPEDFPPAAGDDRPAIRAHWDGVEKKMRAYLDALTDEMLAEKPIKEPEEDQVLFAWQVLLHVANHGTDHRAQLLRELHDLGVETTSQDYIFYIFESLE